MGEPEKPRIIEFPLRGEWLSPNTPGAKVPGHGTEQLGGCYQWHPDQQRKKMKSFKYSHTEQL